MAQRVVDRFELVEIETKQRCRLAVDMRLGQRVIDPSWNDARFGRSVTAS
jgi:hypothetical protein